MRGILRHLIGVGALCLMGALIYAAVVLREGEWSFLLTILSFAAGYHGLRYVRGLGWWAR
jgi:hypothetical protein